MSSPDIDLFRQVQVIFGANVRAKRMALGWTQSYLAERAGIPKWEILRIEQGLFNITLKTITRLVEELGETVPVMLAPIPDDDRATPRRVRSIYRE